ncbi:MAG TPA: hypothetical protein VE343_14545, partial [Streptosporangiaceae bacterium]|nr:hypothetical protein [Streptosporangiaceae bacterium]
MLPNAGPIPAATGQLPSLEEWAQVRVRPLSRRRTRHRPGRSTNMPRALLLSGSLGTGHEVHARACERSLATRGWDTE